jgi:hypothetical protein
MYDLLKLVIDAFKGMFIALLYLKLTKTNDINLHNVLLFSFFYVILINGSHFFLGVDPVIVTNAFITKTIFTIIDERIRKDKK